MANAVNNAGPNERPAQQRDLLIDWPAALEEERDHLRLEKDEQPVALCLSGGGIRSATFCLGVLQELARQGLLDKFHYLSTVSGGSYIGGWLTRAISSQLDTNPDPSDRVDMKGLAAHITRTSSDGEPVALRNLRRYTSFLTPTTGLASLDTWAGGVLWLRNTLINWLVFIPVFIFIVTMPVLFFAFASAILDPNAPGVLDYVFGTIATIGLIYACTRTILFLPSHSHPDRTREPPDRYGPSTKHILLHIILPVLVWCYVSPIAVTAAFKNTANVESAKVVFGIKTGRPTATLSSSCRGEAAPCASTADASTTTAGRLASPFEARFVLLPLLSFFGCLSAYGFAYVTLRRHYTDAVPRNEHLGPFRKSTWAWVFSCAASAGLTWYGIWSARDLNIFWLTLAGPVWAVLAEALRTTLYVAFRKGGLRAEVDREWLARLNALKLALILPAAVIGTAAIVGGLLTVSLTNWALSLAVTGGLTAGSVAAVLGRSAWTAIKTRAPNAPRYLPVEALIRVGIVLFAFTLLIVFGRGVAVTAGRFANLLVGGGASLFWTITGVLFLILAASGLLAYGLGRWINLNRFSMHAVYRNRLVRAFLGSARPDSESRPDRFTQFDPADNLRMADAFDRRSAPVLFPVVNVAMNRTSGKDTARAERKAESFTITPLRCGAGSLCGPEADRADKATWNGAYVATKDYAGNERQTGINDEKRGISLGTAIAISGAAASPNMGYHSSPLIAFIMTLFNVRLGAWLPNPGAPDVSADTLRQAGPKNGLWTLLDELTGRSDRNSAHLYLSDGGHFDNLGLYEMLRRRCRLILVVDASQDESYGYEDLGRTVQHTLVDLGISIEFSPVVVTRGTKLAERGALGKVTYQDGTAGRILYLKPWMAEGLGIEITSYRVRKNDFPHVSTENQFFTESDFEAYRHLGEAIMREAITKASSGSQLRIEDLFQAPVPPAASVP